MYAQLGANYAGSVLAAVATLFCVCPLVFWKYGERLRAASPFAVWSAKVNEENKVDGKWPSDDDLETCSGRKDTKGVDDDFDDTPTTADWPDKIKLQMDEPAYLLSNQEKWSTYNAVNHPRGKSAGSHTKDGRRWMSCDATLRISGPRGVHRISRSTFDTGLWANLDVDLGRGGTYMSVHQQRNNSTCDSLTPSKTDDEIAMFKVGGGEWL